MTWVRVPRADVWAQLPDSRSLSVEVAIRPASDGALTCPCRRRPTRGIAGEVGVGVGGVTCHARRLPVSSTWLDSASLVLLRRQRSSRGAGRGVGVQVAVDRGGDVPLERAERFGVGLALAAPVRPIPTISVRRVPCSSSIQAMSASSGAILRSSARSSVSSSRTISRRWMPTGSVGRIRRSSAAVLSAVRCFSAPLGAAGQQIRQLVVDATQRLLPG